MCQDYFVSSVIANSKATIELYGLMNVIFGLVGLQAKCLSLIK